MTATGSPCSGTSRRRGRRRDEFVGKLVKKKLGGRVSGTWYQEEIKGPPNRAP